MVTKKNIAILLFVCALAAVLYAVLYPDREQQVRRQLDRLSAYTGKQVDEPAMDSMTRAIQASKLFHEPCQITLAHPRLHGRFDRRGISQRISLVRNSFSRLTLSFHDISVTFPENNQADLSLTMRVQGVLRTKEPFDDVRELALMMVRRDGKWLIQRVAEVEILER